MCELCDIIPDKDNKCIITAKKYYALHEEVIDVFHEFFYIPTIETLLFHLAHFRILGSIECGETRNDCFCTNAY